MSDFDTPVRRVFSVSEINSETKKLLEQRFFSVFIRGEVSNFSAPRSGHWYFTLKDEAAQIRVVMFKQANFKHNPPKLGDELVIGGQLSFYRERGEVQVIANQLRPAGLGDLQQQFELLKKKLLDEGLFEQSLKREIPTLPKKIAVITSPTGAVIQDFSRICARRAAAVPILLIPVRVQGQEAAEEICNALTQCQARKDIDLVVLARGGGSLEDFVAFNSESVARCIAACDKPIISGVGHETDVSIADFVADLRAATPSEAAELATAGYHSTHKQLTESLRKISRAIEAQQLGKANQLEKLRLRLKNPADELQQVSQKLDHIESRLVALSKARLAQYKIRLTRLQTSLDPASLGKNVQGARQLLSQLQLRLARNTNAKTEQCQDQLARTVAVLKAINPLSTMTRGYSITFDTTNRVVQSVSQVNVGQDLKVQLRDGSIDCETKRIDLKSDS